VRTIERLEAGERRPSPSLLCWLAGALDPEDPKALTERLIEAAGASLARDTPGKQRHWYRLAMRAFVAGHRPLPADLAREIALRTEISRLRSAAFGAIGEPGVLDDGARLHQINLALDEARRLEQMAGPPFILRFGPHEFRYGFGL
jgi:transcriptional regulator with XRE-family HTH domain